MSKWNMVPPGQRKRIFDYNKQRAADSAAAADMRKIAEAIGNLPKGQLKKILTDDIVAILGRYGVEVG